MRKENVYVNETNQKEFISKSYMRNVLHCHLKSFLQVIEFSSAEIEDGYRDLDYHCKFVHDREKEAYSFIDLAESFGVIDGNEYEILANQIDRFVWKLCIPEKVPHIPDISFLLEKNVTADRSAEAGDYSPGNPWDAPGMSIRDFL